MNDRITPAPLHVLVLCTANSARSQIAEALLQARGGTRIVAESAGTHPADRVNPGAVAVLQAHGISTSGRAPQGIEAVIGRRWDLVVTVCDGARESCPILPGAELTVHWGVPDPAGDPDEVGAFQRAFRVLAHRVDRFLALPLGDTSLSALKGELDRIGGSLPPEL